MLDLDLDNMTLKDLRELRAKIDRAISSFEDRKRRAALSALEDAAREHGFSLSELTGAKTSRRSGGTVAPKYANPEDATQTWTGRGRRPLWVQAALDSGKSMADLEI